MPFSEMGDVLDVCELPELEIRRIGQKVLGLTGCKECWLSLDAVIRSQGLLPKSGFRFVDND